MHKQIKQIVTSRDVMMGAHKIGQPLPANELEQISPFILLHHGAPKTFGPDKFAMEVGPHPHRGFEPVSFIFSGEVEHHDSLGNHSIIGSGGVQWITAAKGIIHSERASQGFKQTGGTFEMIQLWINLPKNLKMGDSKYQAFQRDDILYYEDNKSRVNVISGEIHGLKGPIHSLTDILALTLEIQEGGQAALEVLEDRNILLYQLHGKSSVNDRKLGDQQLVEFEQAGTVVEIEAEEKSLLLFLAGDPIDETMVQYGPFVMNNRTEIMEAQQDYELGRMGSLNY